MINHWTVAPGIILYHVGPALDHGPLPSLFYFSLSGKESLTIDPFNQPVQFLQGKMMRTFSMTLPGHEEGLPASGAMALWAKDSRCIEIFLDSAQLAVEFAVQEKFIDPYKMAIAGLSRGAFIAAHLAARDERFRFLLGFAPVTRLGALKEFGSVKNHPLDLNNLAVALCNRPTRLYIGNNDTQVGTRDCFEFAMKLIEAKKTNPVPVELFISPSIGRMGHGTPPEIFAQGAQWVSSICF